MVRRGWLDALGMACEEQGVTAILAAPLSPALWFV